MCAGGRESPNPSSRDPHYTSGTSEVDFDTAYGGERPKPQHWGLPGMYHEYDRPGDKGWTGELPHPYSWMESFKDDTNREQYYSDHYRPQEMATGSAMMKSKDSEKYDEWNAPDWHYNRDSTYYDWLPDDMQRGQGSSWQIADDARNKERLRIKNTVRAGSGPSAGRDPGSYGGRSHRSQGVNL